MNPLFKTILQYGEDEIIINKSKFIGYSKPVDNEVDAISFIEEIKTKNRSATHNCFAYKITENEVLKQRYSDDGEPSGTAGLPILSVIEKEDLNNLCVVVTRYFGGVKLGAGGLVRAYSNACKISIDNSIIIEMYEYFDISLISDYQILGKVENYLTNQSIIIYNKIYEDIVTVFVYVKISDFEKFKDDLVDLTNDQIKINIIDKKVLPTDIDGNILRRSTNE